MDPFTTTTPDAAAHTRKPPKKQHGKMETKQVAAGTHTTLQLRQSAGLSITEQPTKTLGKIHVNGPEWRQQLPSGSLAMTVELRSTPPLAFSSRNGTTGQKSKVFLVFWFLVGASSRQVVTNSESIEKKKKIEKRENWKMAATTRAPRGGWLRHESIQLVGGK